MLLNPGGGTVGLGASKWAKKLLGSPASEVSALTVKGTPVVGDVQDRLPHLQWIIVCKMSLYFLPVHVLGSFDSPL